MHPGRSRHPNRQPRNGPPSDRGRGRAQGAPNRSARPAPAYTPVPAHSSIHTGTAVSLVLKQDQPTGHLVSGIVADVLTRADHPRGVKVRLRDGRVGRVQSLVSTAEGERGEALVGGHDAGLGRDGEGGGARTRGAGRVERDFRTEEHGYLYDEARRLAPAETGLFAALEEADREYEARWEGGRQRGGGGGSGDTAVCPVCGTFEGDEVAVARHVEGHFGE